MVVGPRSTTLYINVSVSSDDNNNNNDDEIGTWNKNQEYRNKSRPVRPRSWVVLVLLITLCLYLIPHPVLGVRRNHLTKTQNLRKNHFSRPTGYPWTANIRQDDNPNEIDLLQMVEEQSVNNTITKISAAGFLLKEGFNGKISEKRLKNFLRKPSRTFSLHIHGTFRATGKFRSTLLSVYSPKHQQNLPLLEIWIDTWNMSLVVRYQGERSFQRINIPNFIPMDPSSESVSQQQHQLGIGWHQILLTFGPSRLRINVDCLPERVVTLRQKLLPFDKRATFFFGHDKQKSNYVQGLFYKVKLYSHVVQEMQWICPNENALQADDGGDETMTTEERLTVLQRQIDQLMVLVKTLQQQNTKLSERVEYLETCECEPRCKYDDKIFKNKETWQTDLCTICQCQEGKPFCSVRADIPGCSTPCQSSSCQNGGTCISDGEKGTFTCECPHPFSGVHCEVWMNPYVWKSDPGYCHDIQLRYYFDRETDQCLPFNYTGCGGNENNFNSLSECRNNTMSGACCTRKYSVDINSIIRGSQTLRTKCQILSATACRRLHRQSEDYSEELEVVGFYPGLSCGVAQCPVTHSVGGKVDVCHIPGRDNVRVGEKALIGCEECTCKPGGKWKCRCEKINVRKEIRDMTWDETVRFQQAVTQIRLSGVDNVWNRFRDMYMTHSMHSHGGPFYLPWHRVFLRQLEQQLKEVDCRITLPYFDFTTDAANFSRAIIWQPNFFGGDGGGWCVPDHPFGDRNAWHPCLKRNFNHSIHLPTMLDVAVAVSNRNFLEMSSILEAFAGYIHSFIGGEMLTTTSAYDPLFYAIHSYIDQLYATWQKMSNNKHKFPAAYGNIPMVPFNLAPKDVLDLEGDLCVTYAPPTKGRPCNSSESTLGSAAVSGVVQPDILVKVISSSGYDQFGYNQDGFDRRGFDKSGFDRLGFNRDGIDKEGYDKNGYNRYGFDKNGYNKYSFNKLGFDNNGNRDMTSIYSRLGYDRECLNRKGLTRDGYDRYGFNTHGYDSDYCRYSFNGPFVTQQSSQVWEILHTQPHDFLVTLTKTCEPLQPLPNSWYKKFWAKPPNTAVTDLVESDIPLNKEEDIISRNLCFLVKPYISPCPCPKVTTCKHNLCLDAECQSYPEATCHINVCAECTPVWYLKGEIVDCKAVRDYCEPNPCQHGGTCVQSEWPKQKWMVSCHCPPGYEGKNCQYKSTDICSLPLQTGNCRLNISRWYFDYKLSKCVEFHYTGCRGNGNLFETRKDCQERCFLGACCYRRQKNPQYIYGYGPDGFDRYGFDIKGFNKQHKQYNTKTGLERGINRFKKDGYDWQGYDRDGYNSEGYDRLGYDRDGYDAFGFNISGYSKVGEFDGIIDYNEDGYDEEGYNRAGYNCEGVNREGLDYYGRHAGFKYNCQETTLSQCQRLEIEEDVKVINFSPGKTCEESSCESKCGCWFGNKVYKTNQKFTIGCEEFRCQLDGVPKRGICQTLGQRKEIRDLTTEELKRYHSVIKKLQEEMVRGKTSVWFEFARMYSKYLPQALGSPMFLPWHRYFLFVVEKAMQDIDCEVTIPYYDWTIDSGSMEKSIVWSNSFFGGNGDEITECVRYFPFKDFYPPFWSPCLRRQFNTSVNLPDAVHTYLAIQETIFADFSSYMEAMSHLFRMWVGGHMNSPLAPYDPVFISHMAFIDKLWNDWQRRHKKGLLKFPHEHRFTPMEPFRVSPDDVLDCKKQMCIGYVEVTLGSPCNRTEKQTFDSDRFNLHGFDKEGYDRDGFNVQGLNRLGYIDQRGIYNRYNLDREGFSRSGYDPMGFDHHQFYANSYNLDGYDPDGFDRTGRNQYGLDKNGRTPYDLQMDQGSSKERNYFSPDGYNQLGFDRNGFDRKSLDMFGFSKEGFNRFGCNYYFNGPFYLIIFQSIKHKLEQLETIDSLIKIPRLCPRVSQLPNWMYKTYWLNRKQNIPEVLAIMALNRQPNPKPFEEEFGKLWVPPNSDKRFCLESNFFSKCPLGEPPVHCSHDFCHGSTCPGFPNAICRVKGCGHCKVEWYNRQTGEVLQCKGCMDDYNRNKPEGSSWHNENCDNCTCIRDEVTCLPVVCPPVNCDYPSILPGQCCPNCEAGCDYNGKHYRLNSEFRSKSDACKLCYCRAGNVHCEERACPPMDNCHNLVTSEGDCCPTCLNCGAYQNGTEWEDDCRLCTCMNGQVKCKKKQCPPLPCDHPHQPNGKCCPVCYDCELDSTVHKHGSVYEKDECTLCKCQYGTVICQTKNCPSLSCNRPVKLSGVCCPVCEAGCEYSGVKYEHGSVFSPVQDPCKNCTCFKSEVTCAPVVCPQSSATNCHHPVQTFGDCCPGTCPTCFMEGIALNLGERGRSKKNPCKECLCSESGKLECSIRKTCPFECSHGVIQDGECCSQCKDCLVDGRVILDESLFTRRINGCQECYCNDGNIICQPPRKCPFLECKEVVTPEGSCCPRCKGCKAEGIKYDHGDEIRSNDSCTECTCTEGVVLCRKKQCPHPTCQNPRIIPGECCPSCDPYCEYKGITFRHGQVVKDPLQSCLQCTCNIQEVTNYVAPKDSDVTCEDVSGHCPPINCAYPDKARGECCAVCENCFYLRRHFLNKQKFMQPGGDPCRVCTCEKGEVLCSRMNCSVPKCDNPQQLPKSCCPTCPSSCKLRDGTGYVDGEKFVDPHDPCQECICQGSEVTCENKECPPLSCTHPAREPGQCCSTCTFCFYDSRIFRNGQTFLNPKDSSETCKCTNGSMVCSTIDNTCTLGGKTYEDGAVFVNSQKPCEDCVCQRGRIGCRPKPCPTVTCKYPSKTSPSDCCSVCEDCAYYGQIFRNLQNFPDPSARCSTCQCKNGDVTCNRDPCPSLTCAHPTLEAGQCCPTCNNCEYESRFFQNGESFTHPEDKCKNCHCRNGAVKCKTVKCPPVSCTHPAIQEDCCPTCTKCSYERRILAHGQKFADPTDKCRVCQCLGGNVVCEAQECPAVSCSKPVMGECCPECGDCVFNGRVIPNQQDFIDESDDCLSCQCRDGHVQCFQEDCPNVLCTHPAHKRCCKECTNCEYRGTEYNNSQSFLDPQDRCQQCTCENGNVRCQQRQCPVITCQNPVQSDCCLTCEDCLHGNQLLRNGDSVPDTTNECHTCTCHNGDVRCGQKQCSAVTCTHPVQGKCCQECDDCLWNNNWRVTNGGQVDDDSQCKVCECNDGTMVCHPKHCPQVPCSHPAVDKCCPRCENCLIDGEVILNGNQKVTDRNRPCRECYCKNGSYECEQDLCPLLPTSCTDESVEGCSNCTYNGQQIAHTDNFTDPADSCRHCTCKNGNVVCRRKICPRPLCTNPVSVKGSCCPVCTVCNHQGQIYNEGETFTDPRNSCSECVCHSGQVNCSVPSYCNPVSCTHPYIENCCPKCDRCTFEGQILRIGQTVKPDNCRTCTCIEGSVKCIKQSCPPLDCLLKENVPGQCCPQCKGCDYKKRQYRSGTTWFLDENPCVSCTCHGGLVTCAEFRCIVPCTDYLELPGQCCPVCPTCTYKGITYKDGDTFSPTEDPCDQCTCDAGRLRCLHQTCPETATCPQSQLVDPRPGTCCPKCSGFGSNCTREMIGEIIQPRPEDPCFYCECKESYNWICAKDVCPEPLCPKAIQKQVPGTCCPVCPACYYDVSKTYYEDGDKWKDPKNPCILCQCLRGTIQCSLHECQPLRCRSDEHAIKLDGECCEKCVSGLATATCLYHGRIWKTGESWTFDECTTCTCAAIGKTVCKVQKCPSIDCGPNQIPSLLPRSCCPVCQPKSSSCIVYGDPHYQTFDGTTIHFQGGCKYIMAADCENKDFVVEVQHDSRGVSGVSWAQNLTVKIAGLEISFQQNNILTVNGEQRELPFFYDPHVYIEKTATNIILNSKPGMKLVWNGNNYAEIIVPRTYKEKMCGLCGNFNGFTHDDMKTREGQITDSPAIFGNSWKTQNQLDNMCKDGVDVVPCNQANYQKRKFAATKCNVIKSQVFYRCHRLVPPDPFYSSCIYDMCACPEDVNCLCDVIQTYAHQCAKADIRVQWRSATLCPVNCDEEKGFRFDDCGSSCPRTCDNVQSGLTNSTARCYKPCVPSCQCPAHQVVHNGRCIDISQCP